MMYDSQEMGKLINNWLDELSRKAPNSIGDLLHFKLIQCEAENLHFVFLCETFLWMQNAAGTLHGGIISTVLDQGMGLVANCLFAGEGMAPSITLNLAFHRPFFPGDKILMHVYIDSVTKTLIHMRSEAYREAEPERLCVTGTGMFYCRPSAKK